MRQFNFLQKMSPLLNKAIFTSKEAKALGIHPALLSYYTKTGILKRLGRGVYQNSKVSEISPKWSDLIEAIFSVSGGIICLISALAIYGLTEEIPRQHWIAIRHSTSAKKKRGIKIVRLRDVDIGKIEFKLDGVLVPIFDRERTIIDAFRLLSPEIAIKALKMALHDKVGLDVVKLQQYAKSFGVKLEPYLLTLSI